MRIAFSDFGSMDFHVESVDREPMGGTQSAACYLARALARRGQEVFFFSKVSEPGVYDGVKCLSRRGVTVDQLRAMQFDVFICILNPIGGEAFRAALGSRTRIIFWNTLTADQPVVHSLREARCREAFDYIVLVSEWQRSEFCYAFNIAPDRTVVKRNAVAPAFIAAAADPSPILGRKTWPPILAYTSSPYRGLEKLLDIFPRVRAAIGGARLQVFSSMSIYQMRRAEDEVNYGALYRRCRETPGVEYIGAISQKELATALRPVTMLAYPNIFLETSCIAVLEAMASGCRVVTTGWGALPETTAGFANLVAHDADEGRFLDAFTGEVLSVLEQQQRSADACEQRLRRQAEHIGTHADWEVLAEQWIEWLGGI